MNTFKKHFERNSFIAFIAIMCFFIIASVFVPALKAKVASAMPDTFCLSTSSGATSSPAYMTPGTATTTLYASGGCADSVYGAKQYALAVQFTGSSTASTLQVRQEFAQAPYGVNCIATPNACDWYAGTFSSMNNYGTTTISSTGIDMSVIPVYSWKFASSTIAGLAPASNNNRDMKILTFPGLTQYTRFVFTMAQVANGNGAVYAQVIGKKEMGER